MAEAEGESGNERTGRSTGPRTPVGKERSSHNATVHGCCSNRLILPGEDRDEYEQLLQGWMDDFEPSTQQSVFLVREACTAQWFLLRNRRRYNEAEQKVCAVEPNAVEWTDEEHRTIERFRRYLTQAERQFNRSFTMLEQLRKNRLQEGLALQKAQERAEMLEMRRAERLEREAQEAGRTAAAEVAKETKAAERAAAKKKPAGDEAGSGADSGSRAAQMFQGQNSPKKRRKIPTLEQWVEVSVENGQTITMLYPSNKQMIERGKRMWPAPELVYRRFNFPDGVPAEYAWVGVEEAQRELGGCGVQRMTTDTWLELIEREAAEVLRPGYRSSMAPGHLGPTGVGNLPRPQERGGCECPVCAEVVEEEEVEAEAVSADDEPLPDVVSEPEPKAA